MFRIEGTVSIHRPPEIVFAYLSNPKNSLDWETGVVEMELTSDEPIGVGSKGRRVESQMGTDRGTWEITEYEANKTIAMSFESQRFAGEGRWDLDSISKWDETHLHVQW